MNNLYRKKPVVIEAYQYTGNVLDLPSKFQRQISKQEFMGSCYIDTLEGTMECHIGDFIIMGIKGECYPCAATIFYLTYDKE